MFFAWSTPTDSPILYWNLMQNQADLRKVSMRNVFFLLLDVLLV